MELERFGIPNCYCPHPRRIRIVGLLAVKTEMRSSIAACFSLIWVVTGSALFSLTHVESKGFSDFPEGVFALAVVGGWFGIGLALAVSGLRRGNVAAKVCGSGSVLVFVFAAWAVLSPLYTRVRYRKQAPNHPAAASPTLEVSFHADSQWRGVAGRDRWGTIQLYDISGVH